MEPDNSPLLEEYEVVQLLGITAEELAEARKQKVLFAEPYKDKWWQWRPQYRYRLTNLWDFARYKEEVREWFGGYMLPGERIFNTLVGEAIQRGASDVHVQRIKSKTQVRLRINGILHPLEIMRGEVTHYLSGYLALMAERDPRDRNVLLGSCTTTDQAQEYWVRFSSIRALHDMSTTLRILPPAAPTELAELGMRDTAQKTVTTELIESLQPGLTLFAAPQGEGMTTTLRYALYQVNRPENNIIFVDDVMDFPTGAITRLVVDRENGLTPEAIIKVAQRQEATLLVFGEIADRSIAEAALLAVEAGLCVWAGIRVPDFVMNATPNKSARVVYLRFLEWGIREERVHKQLRGVVMQRLLRCLCPICKNPVPIDGGSKARLHPYEIPVPEVVYRAVGCEQCKRTGYSTRTGLFSVYVAEAEAAMGASFADQAVRRYIAGETDEIELDRLDAWGLNPHRNRNFANNELVQKL